MKCGAHGIGEYPGIIPMGGIGCGIGVFDGENGGIAPYSPGNSIPGMPGVCIVGSGALMGRGGGRGELWADV